MAIRLINNSSFLKEQGNTKWWEWTIFISTDSIDEFNDIEYVEYFIRDSFDNSIVKIKQKKGGFQYTSQGWKESEIRAKVYFSDKPAIVLQHTLKFDDPESQDARGTKDELNILINTNPNFADILYSSPFDPIRNINGTLTENVFFENLFVLDENQNNLVNQILSSIDSQVQNYQILFLTGFAGTGKTTTIKYLINELRNDKHVYIDLAELALYTDFESVFLQKALTNYIQKNIRSNLSSNDKPWFWELIKDKLVPLSKYFTDNFVRNIRHSENESSFQEQLLESNDFGDVFTLFVLYIYFNNENIDNKTYVYFDNLDAVNSRYFSGKFFERFSRTIYSLALLSQDDEIFSRYIDFRSNFKFVFCMREENFSTINPHIRDSLEPIYKTLKLEPSKSQHYYLNVIRKRFDFYRFIHKNIRNDFNAILASLQYFLEKAVFFDFQELYNYDFRKISSLIMDFYFSTKTINFNKITDNFIIKSKLFNALTLSISQSEIVKFLSKQSPFEHSKLILLMLLLCNRSNSLSKYSEPNSIMLKEVREYLQGFVSESLLERYIDVLSCDKNWSLLINLEKSDNQNTRLINAEIDINPSVFNFLRRIYPSYEFFSLIANMDLIELPEYFAIDSFDKHKLEIHLQKVLKLVKDIFKAKEEIFTNELSTRHSIKDNIRSNFEFRLQESNNGTFSARIIYHHISYVEELRIMFLRNNFDTGTKLSVNMILIDTVREYCKIVVNGQKIFSDYDRHYFKTILDKISKIDLGKVAATNILD